MTTAQLEAPARRHDEGLGPDGAAGYGGAPPPETCAVSVIAPFTQVDITVPAGVPVAALVPELVELAESRRPVLAPPGADDPDAVWVLGRIGHPPLAPARTLAEQGIADGTLLHLRRAEPPLPEPLFDDVIDAVAAAGAAGHAQWAPRHARRAAYTIALLASLAAAALLVAGPPAGAAPIALAAVCAAAAASAGIAVARTGGDRRTGAVLCWCALPFAATGGSLLAAPRPGAPGVLLGCAAAAACAALCAWASRCGTTVHTAVVTASLLCGTAAAATLLTGAGPVQAGAALLVAAPALLAAAPRLTVLLARLPLPPVPSRDLQADLDGDSGPVAAGPALAAAARRGAALLTGLTAGAAFAAAAGAEAAAAGRSPSWPGIALAGVVAAVLMLRGRAHADAAPAAVLIAGGALAAAAAVVTPAVCGGMPAWAAAAGLGAGAALALACGVAGPRATVSPVLRRAVELAEAALTVAVLPLALWAMDAYAAMRAL